VLTFGGLPSPLYCDEPVRSLVGSACCFLLTVNGFRRGHHPGSTNFEILIREWMTLEVRRIYGSK
jgi:hypothetical protein